MATCSHWVKSVCTCQYAKCRGGELDLTVKEMIVYMTIKPMMPMIGNRSHFLVAILSKAHPMESFTMQTPHCSMPCETKLNFMPVM